MLTIKFGLGMLLLAVSCVHESAANTIGNMSGKHIQTHVNGCIKIDGALIAQESINLSAGECIAGDGYLEAPVIELTTHICMFTGTMNCSKKCIIRTQKPFDATMLTMTGGGELEVIVEPVLSLDELVNEHGSNITRGLFVMTTLGVLGYKLYKYGTSKC